jgi:pimeloyl-ACP methyl ester carboxylesterase
MADAVSQTLALRDGRRLGYATYGKSAGIPVFYFHAAASSRLEHPADEDVLFELGIRFIATDRPGHGLSASQPDRKLLDWPDDIRQLGDHLKIKKFHTLGYSNGGPHALVCAYRLPDRVMAGAVVSSVAPMNRPGAFRGMPLPNRILNASARWAPWFTRLMRRMMRVMLMDDVEKATQRLMSSIPEADKALLYAPENLDAIARSVREGFRIGWQGVAQDDIVVNQDWGFDVADIKPHIDIWHGEADVNVPCHAGEYLHRTIPSSRATFLPNEGHFLLVKHWEEVLAALVSDR